ncbi:hypothetical protein [Nitrosomonas sp. Nm84]|uniref:hypothetical protein n=1 Tax=Nitrosomonas sp. Nm84 TaxID=200124 RepID=UPI00104E284A|nr:hypothetical protein [Nitrosomonas sp. Nm84]
MKMKLFNFLLAILAACLIFSSPIMAATDQDPNFITERNREIANAKERIHISEGRIDCIQKAKDFEALKTCNKAADRRMDDLEVKIKVIHSGNKPNHPDNKQDDSQSQHN